MWGLSRSRSVKAGGVAVGAALVAILIGASSCVGDTSGQAKDEAARNAGFNRLQASQPAVYMEYSPTRAGIKFFAEKWGKDPNKLSYVYLTNMEGNVVRYFVLQGLPISYCAQMLPPIVRNDSVDGDLALPAPAVDGAYYGGNSGCNQYYGKDATSGSYVEWTQFTGYTMVTEQPIGRPETDDPAKAGGPTAIGEE